MSDELFYNILKNTPLSSLKYCFIISSMHKFYWGISGNKMGQNKYFYFCNVLTFCLINGEYFAICKKFPLSFYNVKVHFHSAIALKLISIIGRHDITELLVKVVLSTIN